jgi:soluble lytic murein transglycosylase-like protein
MRGIARVQLLAVLGLAAVLATSPASRADPEATAPPPSEPAGAREAVFPIRFDREFLGHELVKQAFSGADGEARLLDDDSGCNYLVLRDPAVELEEGQLRVRARGEARTSFEIGEICLFPLGWEGIAEVVEVPRVDEDGAAIRFEVVDTELLGPDGEWLFVSSTIWDWVKSSVHPSLETRIDLRAAVEEIRAILPLFLSRAERAAGESLLASVQIVGVEVSPEAVRVDVRIEVPELVPAAPPPHASPEPALAPDELGRWNAALRRFDAFLTFVVKATGRDTKVAELRTALLDVLLNERFELAQALAGPAPQGETDPVRGLFLRTWRRLAPVVRRVADRLPAERSLAYLSFVSAGDALVALDRLGPAVGLEISADGLRRLARIIAPAEPGDPVAYDDTVDPELRELFGFGPPLPVPAEPAHAAGDGAGEAGVATPAGDAATPTPAPDESSPGEPAASGWSFFASAHAATVPDDLAARLNRWAPTREDAKEYLPLAGRLLDAVADHAVVHAEVAGGRVALFRATLLATAWQESCWRQFIERGGQLRTLRSPVGSLGIMQVNQHVWRGFYDVGALSRDIDYNARAGSEILGRYWNQAVDEREHERGGTEASLGRATYAAYNGGPAALTRYRRSGRPTRERRVDAGFAAKLETMLEKGDPLAVLECFGEATS